MKLFRFLVGSKKEIESHKEVVEAENLVIPRYIETDEIFKGVDVDKVKKDAMKTIEENLVSNISYGIDWYVVFKDDEIMKSIRSIIFETLDNEDFKGNLVNVLKNKIGEEFAEYLKDQGRSY